MGLEEWVRKEVVAFVSIMILTVLAAQYLPGYLDLPAGRGSSRRR